MDSELDRRGDPPTRGFRPSIIGTDADWLCIGWAEPHFAVFVTNGQTDDAATCHGPTCANCRTLAKSVLQARQRQQEGPL